MKSLGIEKIPSQGLAEYRNVPNEHRFSPYADNGGSLVAIAGDDYAVIASDTRLTGMLKHGSSCHEKYPPPQYLIFSQITQYVAIYFFHIVLRLFHHFLVFCLLT
jgi:hypothetical protein